MKLKKLVCLGFSGDELEASYWQELDALADERVFVVYEAKVSGTFHLDSTNDEARRLVTLA